MAMDHSLDFAFHFSLKMKQMFRIKVVKHK